MTTPHLARDIAQDEGLRLTAYPDPESSLGKAKQLGMTKLQGLSGAPWTIGHGHTGPEVCEGLCWTPEEAAEALRQDIATACAELDRHAPWWRSMCDARQDVLANMAFNLGWTRLSKFKNTLAAMQRHDYEAAAKGMLKSLWAKQVGRRALTLAEQMRTGARASR